MAKIKVNLNQKGFIVLAKPVLSRSGIKQATARIPVGTQGQPATKAEWQTLASKLTEAHENIWNGSSKRGMEVQ